MAQLKGWFKAKGSYGLYYGLGVDEVAVNFEDISGLVTLAGENGRGKTTFMEMLSPFDVFPSRQMKDPKRYNLKKQFRLRDSYKEVCYIHQGREYLFRVEIPAGTTMSPEGYIWRDGEPLVKGKISQYRKKVVELFGSEKLFYSSMFSCQGGKKLTDLPTGEFKGLLIELLGLKRYVEYWHSVGKVITECERSLARCQSDLEGFENKTVEIDENNRRLDGHKRQLETYKEDISGAELILTGTVSDIEKLSKQAVEAAKKEATVAEKKKQLAALEETMAEAREVCERAAKSYVAWQDAQRNRLSPFQAIVAQEKQILTATEGIEQIRKEEKIWQSRLNALSEQGTNIRDSIDAINTQISDHQAQVRAWDSDSQMSELTDKISQIKTDIESGTAYASQVQALIESMAFDAVAASIEKELAAYAKAEDLISRRPPDCIDDTCSFIKNALEQIKEKPAKEKELADRRAENARALNAEKERLAKIETDITRLKDELSKTKTALEERARIVGSRAGVISAAIKTLEKKRDEKSITREKLLAQYAEVKGYIDGVPDRIEELQALAGKKADLDMAKQELTHAAVAAKEKQAEQDKTLEAYTNQSVELQALFTRLENDVIALSLNISSADIARKQQQARSVSAQQEKEIERLKGLVSETEKAIAVCEEKAKGSLNDAAEIDRLRKLEKHIRKEISRWAYIRGAVSKSGLQALEIAAAAPLLTGLANDLLTEAYGGEFFVDLVTQDPETGAEILDIMISRGDGQSFPLADYSGGESVWILQAFKAAQILVNAEKSGVHFQTCFADEESGALDKDKAERFIKMYRALMAKGDFEKLFFISHIPDCQAMADHALIFQHGGIVSESNIAA